MDDLKTMMDSLSIKDINENVHQFIHSADGNDNKIKLTFVLLNLIHEGLELLKSINFNDFISEVKSRVDEIGKQTKSLSNEYYEHLKQNKEITELLSDKNDNRISDLQSQISKMLSEYDGILKTLVEARDKLPIEKQIEQEKK